MNDNIEEKTWQEFRNTGLFMFINSILHVFGWMIVIVNDAADKDDIKRVFPARTKYRGFTEADQDDMHTKIATYTKGKAEELYEDIQN